MKKPGVRPVAVAAGVAVVVPIVLGLLSPVDPLAWSPPPPLELSGPLQPNRALRDAERVGAALDGPEDVEVDPLGRIYCGLADGSVRRSGPAGAPPFEIFADTGGRPQGLDLDAVGTLWVADSRRGLLSIDGRGGVTLRAAEAGGVPVGFANDVSVSSTGRIYFSDASTRFGPHELLRDALEARPHGRLLEYDPRAGVTRPLLEGLHFANGVAVSIDARYVLVAETFRYRIRRVWLDGPEAGRDEVLVDRLPGFPDGIATDDDGTFWLALHGRRSRGLDRLHPRPWLKRLVAWLPPALQAGARPYGLVLAFDGEGRILRSLHDPGGIRVSGVTSVEPHEGALYLGSIERGPIGRLQPSGRR